MSMYVRVKRKKQTVFLTCEPSDTILDLKRKLSSINSLDVSLSSKRERARACETIKDREREGSKHEPESAGNPETPGSCQHS